MPLRAPLQAIVDTLLRDASPARAVTLDDLGNALGILAVTTLEIDEMIGYLETHGQPLNEPAHASGVDRLRVVLEAARALRAEKGRIPTSSEIAERAAIPLEAVNHALLLAQIIQR